MTPRNANLVVVLGASYAQGWKPAPLGPIQFLNKGVGGERSYEMLARFDRDVAAHHPRAVILWGFINDITRAERAHLTEALARIRESYVAMIDRSRRAGIEPVIATELTIRQRPEWSDEIMTFVGGLLGRQGYPDFVNRHVLDTNVWLRDLAKKEGLLLLDIEPVLSNGTGRRTRAYVQPDGSHVSPAGYAALSAYATPRLQAHWSAAR